LSATLAELVGHQQGGGEDAEAAGIGDRSGQGRAGHPTHAGLE
jgi:hypothetical protein